MYYNENKHVLSHALQVNKLFLLVHNYQHKLAKLGYGKGVSFKALHVNPRTQYA